jgi:APA family basic amino acid/polyamine antiporter
MVAIGIVVLRYRQPNVRRPFRAPLVPLVPMAALVFTVATMATMAVDVWVRFIAWNVVGLIVLSVGIAKRRSAKRVH